MAAAKPQRPFGIRDKIGYMFGDVGNCFILGLVNGFLLIYCTNALGIPAALVGAALMLSKVFDAFVDVYVGHRADQGTAHEEHGRFIPWIKRFRYPFILVSILLFVPWVAGLPIWAKVAYVFVVYVCYNVFLSCVNIPYGALASAVSGDPTARASLSTFRSTGSAIAGAVTGAAIPLFMYTVNPAGEQVVSANNFFVIAIVCGVLAWISYEITIKLTTERVHAKAGRQITARQLVNGLIHDRALLALVVADLFVVINQQLAAINQTYLFDVYFQDRAGMSIAVAFNYITVILMAPFATKLSARFGKREMSIATLLFAVAVYAVMFFMKITDWRLYLVLMFFGALGFSYFTLMVWAFITDVIDHHQSITKVREDGTIYGVNSFSRKIGQAASTGIGGLLLTSIGYQSGTTADAAVQSAATVQGVYNLTCLIPVVCLGIAALILIFWYPLNKEQVAEDARTLEALRAETAEAEVEDVDDLLGE